MFRKYNTVPLKVSSAPSVSFALTRLSCFCSSRGLLTEWYKFLNLYITFLYFLPACMIVCYVYGWCETLHACTFLELKCWLKMCSQLFFRSGGKQACNIFQQSDYCLWNMFNLPHFLAFAFCLYWNKKRSDSAYQVNRSVWQLNYHTDVFNSMNFKLELCISYCVHLKHIKI